ncbi:MAG: diheme cytochrome c-553 [Flavisolibacter sp.]
MKKITVIIFSFVLLVSSGLLACNGSKAESRNEEGITEVPKKEAQIRRGEYLVTIMGCNDCHSPKIMTPHGPEIDTAHLLSGHPSSMPLAKIESAQLQNWVLFNQTTTAMAGPWGVSFAANLTSDETGIGNWSEAQFFKAIREGKYKGMDNTRPLLPPMPWMMYRNASDEDLSAIFAYLKSTAPVTNRVPAPIAPGELAQLH